VAEWSAVIPEAASSGTLSVSPADHFHCSRAVLLQDGVAGAGRSLVAGGDTHKSTVLPGEAGVSYTMTTSDAVTASPDSLSSSSLRWSFPKMSDF